MRALGAAVLLSCGIAWAKGMPAAPPPGAQSPGRTNGGAQSANPSPTQQPINNPFPNANIDDSRLEHDQAKLRNVDRQKQIVADTQKLVTLTSELNAAVEKSNKDTLSPDVIHKADEIEKLAKSVREKMKGI